MFHVRRNRLIRDFMDFHSQWGELKDTCGLWWSALSSKVSLLDVANVPKTDLCPQHGRHNLPHVLQ